MFNKMNGVFLDFQFFEKENVSDVSNKENIFVRKVNCKKKKKFFLELDIDV